MRYSITIGLLMALFTYSDLQAQSAPFLVKLAPFCSRLNDEFSPVFYKGGIVFCSNQRGSSLIGYTDGENQLFKIYYVTKQDSVGEQPLLLAKELTTDFNDGPVTFGEDGNMVYFSRNNVIEKPLRNIVDSTNKLGLYSAQLVNGIWSNIKPFRHNNPLYNLSTPALTPKGDRIYFASDMPGGSGGMDLYYCNRHNDDWGMPVSLGPIINTPSNESFPFACQYGKLFFASEGHAGFGGKDIFYTQEINGEWIVPVHLDSPINTTADDFGLVADSTIENGFFSSNRLQTDDIFGFRSAPVEFTNCDSIREDNYCFTFSDEQNQLLDTTAVTYQWDFGEGMIRIGEEVNHCFPGPGTYSVKLRIVDSLTGKAIAEEVEYTIDLENVDQACINSYNVGIVGKPISFDAVTNNLKGFRVTDYYWNFGDGFTPGAPSMTRIFKKEGVYPIQMGILAKADSLGRKPKTCVSKTIRIYDGFHELEVKGEYRDEVITAKVDSLPNQSNSMDVRIYLLNDLSRSQRIKIDEGIDQSYQLILKIDRYGVLPVSYPFLDGIVRILKQNPNIRLEIVLHAVGLDIRNTTMQPSEQWARELAFYFKNKGIARDQYQSKSLGIAHSGFEPFPLDGSHVDGIVEFIFMSN